jgi:hypothetical protein
MLIFRTGSDASALEVKRFTAPRVERDTTQRYDQFHLLEKYDSHMISIRYSI